MLKQNLKPQIDEGNFYETINQAIAEKQHVDYLKQSIKEYEDYKEFFNDALTDKNPWNQVYTFKVIYLLKRPIWRIFEVSGLQNFNQFAEAIIDSMDWDNDHMHGFSLPDHKQKNWQYYLSRYTIYAPGWEDDPHPTLKTDEVKIENIDYNKFPKLRFLFDFGDGHMFDIDFIGSREFKKKDCIDDFPKLTDIRGVGPEQYPYYR